MDAKKKLKRRVCQVPQSLNFSHNYLSSTPQKKEDDYVCKTLPEEELINKETPRADQFDPNKVLSSRLSSNLFFHYRHSYLNEKIMHFNAIKNQDSFRTNKTEYIINKNMINLSNNHRPGISVAEPALPEFEEDEEEFKYELYHEPEIKFTENTEKSIEKEKDLLTIDSKLNDSFVKMSEINRNLDFNENMKHLDFFPVSSSRNKYESLIIALFSDDMKKINEALERDVFFLINLEEYNLDITKEDLNRKDFLDNTPLFIAIKLCRRSPAFLEVIKRMLQLGADPNISDRNNWTTLDEAVNQGNIPLVVTLFDVKKELKRRKLLGEEQKLLEMLNELPDFYLEMKWDFESSIIPFLNKMAPSDTFKLWKHKNSLRLDYNLVGINGLRAKKREMSLIFNPRGFLREDALKFDSKNSKKFWILNRSKKIYTNPLVSK